MPTGAFKMKLQVGGRKISASGSRSEVEGMIEKWWPKLASQALDGEDEPTDVKKVRPPKRKSGRNPKPAPLNAVDDASSFDAVALANDVKEHDKFALIKQKIIDRKGDPYHKVAFVIWFANEALTSGKIYKVLGALDVKISLPKVSTTLKSNISNFLTDGQRKSGAPPAEYRLTGKAKTDFETWLNSKG